MKLFIILCCITLEAFAIGFIQIPAAEKAQLETQVKQGLQIPHASLQLARLGGDGGKTYNFIWPIPH